VVGFEEITLYELTMELVGLKHFSISSNLKDEIQNKMFASNKLF
jgi:hypothetical protein